jgi:hypothetical protein
MKKVILTIGILAGVSSTFAQVGRVGINTDDPKATLHIKADKDNKDNNPGLIIPDVSKDKLDTGEPVESTLVYYSEGSNSAYINQNDQSTTENIGSKKGFYYYDGTDWQRIIRKAQFYMPSIVVPTTVNTRHEVNLYQEYIKQYAHENISNVYKDDKSIIPSSDRPIASSVGASPLKTYRKNDLDYFVVYYDNNVFTNLSITEEGVLTYTVTAEGAKNISAQTFMNIVLQER